MTFIEDLKQILENQEESTVGDAFGGPRAPGRTPSYSLTTIRDWVIDQGPLPGNNQIEEALNRMSGIIDEQLFKACIGSMIRFSFLIELTNLKVGSTKMKTRWLPGKILMPQEGSFEPIQGVFQPGNDPRSTSFEDCLDIFITVVHTLCDNIEEDPNIINLLRKLKIYNSVPYEFVFDYSDYTLDPIHNHLNISWALNDDIKWLLKAREILNGHLNRQEKNKIQTKTYKTDRALTGKDKTNRAKRWEVLNGDFQHASLTDCWSVEKKLLKDLVCFNNFPIELKNQFVESNLIAHDAPTTRCPVTLLELDYEELISAAVHGISKYQIGHLHPLKRGGNHHGDNVCWQSADGNRIQGDLTMDETLHLLEGILLRKQQLGN